MSLRHYTLVGHFDLDRFNHRRPACIRPIEPAIVARLLTEYPSQVADLVQLVDGYVRCEWAALGFVSPEAHEFAHRLADHLGCSVLDC